MDAAPDHDARAAGVRARLHDITGGTPGPDERALLVRLLRSFADQAPATAGTVIDLLDGGELRELRERAHALRGSAANIGATGLAALCAGIERDARAGRRPAAGTARRLGDEVTETVRAVTAVADAYEC